MTIARKLNRHLAEQHADYEIIGHGRTESAMATALSCHIPMGQMAKAVLLDTEQDHLLVVLPANRRLELAEMRSDLGTRAHLASERELAAIFDDCVLGAIPPMGSGYGIETVVDDSLDVQPDIYFEAGDHTSLVHMNGAEFSRLTRQSRRGHFSDAWSSMA